MILLFTIYISIYKIIAGILYKYINRQITITILLTLLGISLILVPYSQKLWHLYLCAFVFGLGSGNWYTGLSVWIIELWQQKSPPMLQLLQFLYGIGTIFGPLIDKPYLTGEHQYNSNTTNISVNERRSKLKIPFLIIGVIEMIGI